MVSIEKRERHAAAYLHPSGIVHRTFHSHHLFKKTNKSESDVMVVWDVQYSPPIYGDTPLSPLTSVTTHQWPQTQLLIMNTSDASLTSTGISSPTTTQREWRGYMLMCARRAVAIVHRRIHCVWCSPCLHSCHASINQSDACGVMLCCTCAVRDERVVGARAYKRQQAGG